MALEERRLTHLENNVDILTGLSNQLFEMTAESKQMIADNKQMIALMDARLTAADARHEARMERLEERQARHDEEMVELRRGGQQLQRIWIRLARKNGWDDLLDEEE